MIKKLAVLIPASLFALAACDRIASIDHEPDRRDGRSDAEEQTEIMPALESIETELSEMAAPVNAPVTEFATVTWSEAVAETAFEGWNNRAGAQGVIADVEGIALRFDSSGDLIWVVREFEPRAGETYRVELDLAVLGGSSPQVRMMLSRECSTGGEDLAQSIVQPGAEPERVAVEHTYAADHGCQKLVFQVLNASPETPHLLTISAPSAMRVED